MNDNIFGDKREISLPLRLKILFGGTLTQVFYGCICFSAIMLFIDIKSPVNTRRTSKTAKIITDSVFGSIFILGILSKLRYNLRSISLLKTGQMASATIINTQKPKKRGNINLNTYYFEDKNGKKYSSTLKFHKMGILPTGTLQTIFYEVNNPKNNILTDNLYTEIKLQKDNTFKSPNLSEGLVLLILPIIAVCIIVVCTFNILYFI